MRLLRLVIVFLVSTISSVGVASPPSILGGKTLGAGTAHHFFVGWPSFGYEWWNGAGVDWMLGVELVYGDWAAAYSDVDVGGAFNVGLRVPLKQRGMWTVALRFVPGILIGDGPDGPGDDNNNGIGVDDEDDHLVIAGRGDTAIAIGAAVHEKVNLITGLAFPVTVIHVQDVTTGLIIPILIRFGVEVMPLPDMNLFFIGELGPTVGIFDDDSDVDAGFRVWIGTTIF